MLKCYGRLTAHFGWDIPLSISRWVTCSSKSRCLLNQGLVSFYWAAQRVHKLVCVGTFSLAVVVNNRCTLSYFPSTKSKIYIWLCIHFHIVFINCLTSIVHLDLDQCLFLIDCSFLNFRYQPACDICKYQLNTLFLMQVLWMPYALRKIALNL